MLAGNGSAMIAASSCSAVAARSASGSFQGTMTVAAVAAAGTPGEAGMACVARPEPASASSPSTWPWYAPANFRILSRPVAARASRNALIVASVPDEVMRSISTEGMRVGDLLGERDLAPGWRAEARAALGRGDDCLEISGWAWPWMSGPHEHHPVDVAVAVGVDDLRALGRGR